MIDTSLDSTNFYFLIAVFQGFVLSCIIIFRFKNSMPNLFFGILVFLFSLSLLHLILEESVQAFNSKFPIPMEFSLSYGPLAYFHVLYIKNPMRIFKWKDFLHFLPSLLLDGVFFTLLFTYIRFNTDWAYSNISFIQKLALIMGLIGMVQIIIYTYLIYRESITSKNLLIEFKTVRRWLKYLIISWCFLVGFLIFAIPIALFFIKNIDENSSYFYKPLGIILGLFIYFLGYLYLLKYLKVIENYSNRMLRIHFSENDLRQKKEELLYVLTKDELYRDSELTISKLATHLGWPTNNLSRIINDTLHTTFIDLINSYRVEAFKKNLINNDNEKYSILGLSEKSGFNSKTSFYRVFKKETGMTPSEYLNSLH
ncbi:helix-turn-helix domain-containing protein [uncultured Psychroserpens sp.]|uniref:helix-turn-helix domain-containing protein n=1 Tax=uncultured Psychroserpens sp. TaxID=255436 RepID=UPI00262EE304|nr:helix-turn-helix domain-containing protein [uncultured Psychroserpens sp.]